MAFMNTINIVGSGLTAQQLRLDIVAENVTNSQTTRTENGGGAYRRKLVVFEAVSGRDTFRDVMARAAAGLAPNGSSAPTAGGVRVAQIVAQQNGNIIKLDHNQFVSINRQSEVELQVTLEAFGHDHKETILDALRQQGYNVRLVQSKSVYN